MVREFLSSPVSPPSRNWMGSMLKWVQRAKGCTHEAGLGLNLDNELGLPIENQEVLLESRGRLKLLGTNLMEVMDTR
jgi:hypothetical protein